MLSSTLLRRTTSCRGPTRAELPPLALFSPTTGLICRVYVYRTVKIISQRIIVMLDETRLVSIESLIIIVMLDKKQPCFHSNTETKD